MASMSKSEETVRTFASNNDLKVDVVRDTNCYWIALVDAEGEVAFWAECPTWEEAWEVLAANFGEISP